MSKSKSETGVAIQQAAAWLQQADKVLVVTGAGMSIGTSPTDYFRAFVDQKAWRHHYPELARKFPDITNMWSASFSGGRLPAGWWKPEMP